MKKFMTLFILALIPFAMMADQSYASDSLTKLKKVAKSKVTAKTVAAGMETFYGEKIRLSDVKKRWFRKKTIKEVLSRSEIELNSGHILYPSEVQFALVPKRGKAPKGDERAPKEDEKAPKDDE